MKLKADESSEPWESLEFSGKNTDHVKEPREQWSWRQRKRQSRGNRLGIVGWIDPSGDGNNSVNPKQQGDRDSVTTLVEVSEPECQVKSGRMPLEIGDTQRTEITEGTNPLRYPKEDLKEPP